MHKYLWIIPYIVANASAQITPVFSTTEYIESHGDWLSMSNRDLGVDRSLGSDGFIFFGNFDGSSAGGQSYNSNTTSLPEYVSAHTAGTHFDSVAAGFAHYGVIDNPASLDGNNAYAGVAIARTSGEAGLELEVMNFTISDISEGDVVRVGILAGIEGNPDGRWDPTSISLSDGVNKATVGDHDTSPLTITDTGWVFFDLTSAGTYTVSGTTRIANTGGISIGGLTFDKAQITTEPIKPAFTSTAYAEISGDWLSISGSDIGSDDILGTDGFIFFGAFNGSAASGQPYTTNVSSLPAYISNHAAGADFSLVAAGFGSYGAIDNPLTLDGQNAFGGIAGARGGAVVAGSELEVMSFTISDLAPGEVVRVGILSGIEANSTGIWDATSISLSNESYKATVGDPSLAPLEITNTGWVFFDITSPGTYTVSGTTRVSYGGGVGIGGITFDKTGLTLAGGSSLSVDFGSIEPESSTYFNHYSDLTIANAATEAFANILTDSEGSYLGGVGFSITNNSGQETGRAVVNTGSAGYPFITDSTVYTDCLISNDTAAAPLTDGTVSPLTRGHFVLTFTGLDDSLTYNLSGGFYNGNSNFNSIWTADGESFSADNADSGYGILTDLSTDGNGTLEISVMRASNESHLAIGALRLTAVGPIREDGGLNFPLVTPAGGYSFPDAFPALTFDQIGSLDVLDGHPEKLFVVQTNGLVWMIPDVTAETPEKVLFLDLSTFGTNSNSNSVGGIAFHPDFDNNGYCYLTYPSTRYNCSRVSRFTADPTTFELIDNSTEVIFIEESFQPSHGFNHPIFGPDGYLYVPIGDGKQVPYNSRPPERLTQTIDEGFWSSVLRIDVDKLPGNYEPQNLVSNDANGRWTVPVDENGLAYYSIPADNPFLDTTYNDGRGVSAAFSKATEPFNVRTEMYCIGLRNPWKIGFVPNTDTLWVADVMSAQKERYLIMPKGSNAGWGFYSGTGDVEELQSYYGVEAPADVAYIQPVVEYNTSDSGSGIENKSIIGGDFYTATDIPKLSGAFIFCDYNRGNIFALHRDNHSDYQEVYPVQQTNGYYALDDTGMTESTLGGIFDFGTYNGTVEQLGVEAGITAMVANPTTGEMLLADSTSIRKITYSEGDFDSQLPQTLTATGAIKDTLDFVTSDAMHPYDVNLTFWSDGALKSRYINLVDTSEPITFSEDGFWEYPAGTVTMKHFDMDLDRDNPGTNVKRIETRFLVKTHDGFYGMTYQWDDEGTEATLVPEDGANVDLAITEGGVTTTQTWRLPSRAECYQCHTAENQVMLGFNTRQLNHEGSLNGVSGNFLTLLENAGYLSTLSADPSYLPKYSHPSDTSVDLEERAKSYIAVNCAYCHYDGNSLVPASWSGEHHLGINATDLLLGEAIGFKIVDTSDRLVIPGDTANSIILNRAAAANGYSRMPPIGSNVIDQEGVALLTEWINNYANVQPELNASTSSLNIAANTPTGTSLGAVIDATDADYSTDRNQLTYSIVAGNDEGYFSINALTGEISLNADSPAPLSASSQTITIMATDGFTNNPGTVTADVAVNFTRIPYDWAQSQRGTPLVDPSGDSDNDGTPDLFEYFAGSNPNDPGERFAVDTPMTQDDEASDEREFFFEWFMRKELVAGTDYLIQGMSEHGESFETLAESTDYTVALVEEVADNPLLNRICIKVPSSGSTYLLRITAAE